MFQRKKSVPDNGTYDDSESDEGFKALFIIIFCQTAVEETILWLLDRLTLSQHEGGAELLVRVHRTKNEGTILEIGATTIRLLEAAEALEITKEDKNGNIREFVFSNIDQFFKKGVTAQNILSTSEKQRIVLEEIMSIRALDKKMLDGYSHIQLFPGQSIIQVCRNHGIIEHMYPLHERTELKELINKWTFKSLPLGDIRNYFGESVAFYFAFISYYTWALLPPAAIGFCQTIYSFDITRSHLFFATFKMIWLTIFLEFWKRRSNELAYAWGTLRLVNLPKLHPTFRGRCMQIDSVTKQHVPVYPGYRRHLKVYCVSLPLVCLCLIFAVLVMFVYFQIEDLAMEMFDDGSYFGWLITQLPGIIYAVLVYAMNVAYAYVANVLTEWENHKTQDSFDNHRIVKLLLFEFVNNFIAMGYIAFYQQDFNMLKWQIAVMMVVNHLFNQFQEAILPFLIQKFNQRWKKTNFVSNSPQVEAILEQRDMWSYEDTYDDYLEVFTQFGYVFLFSSVFPFAAVLAVLNNVLEIWMDGFKLCYSYQRPKAKPVKGIGIWQVAFEVLSLFAVMTNCALISMSPIVRSYAPDMSLSTWLLIAVVIEHIIIAVKMVLSYIISDVPKWVNVAIQKAQYESLQALKIERRQRTKDMLKTLKLKNTDKTD